MGVLDSFFWNYYIFISFEVWLDEFVWSLISSYLKEERGECQTFSIDFLYQVEHHYQRKIEAFMSWRLFNNLYYPSCPIWTDVTHA